MTAPTELLARARELAKPAEMATPGPWTRSGVVRTVGLQRFFTVLGQFKKGEAILFEINAGHGDDEYIDARHDADFIASARTAVPELLAIVEELARLAILHKSEANGVVSLLLDMRRDCNAEHRRAETAEARVAELEVRLAMRR